MYSCSIRNSDWLFRLARGQGLCLTVECFTTREGDPGEVITSIKQVLAQFADDPPHAAGAGRGADDSQGGYTAAGAPATRVARSRRRSISAVLTW